jgi:hypothetical protein
MVAAVEPSALRLRLISEAVTCRRHRAPGGCRLSRAGGEKQAQQGGPLHAAGLSPYGAKTHDLAHLAPLVGRRSKCTAHRCAPQHRPAECAGPAWRLGSYGSIADTRAAIGGIEQPCSPWISTNSPTVSRFAHCWRRNGDEWKRAGVMREAHAAHHAAFG